MLRRQIERSNVSALSAEAKFEEFYGRLEDSNRDFDVQFWQRAGDMAIFDAAQRLILDYLLIREGYAEQPRLQRSVESFQKC